MPKTIHLAQQNPFLTEIDDEGRRGPTPIGLGLDLRFVCNCVLQYLNYSGRELLREKENFRYVRRDGMDGCLLSIPIPIEILSDPFSTPPYVTMPQVVRSC